MGQFFKIYTNNHYTHYHCIIRTISGFICRCSGATIDVGVISKRQIKECAMKQHKTAALLFPSLITSLCLVSGVRATVQDEHIKNAGALNTRTIK